MQFARRDGSKQTCVKEGFLECSLPSKVQMCSSPVLENAIKKERNTKQRGQDTQHRLYPWEDERGSQIAAATPDWKIHSVPMAALPSRTYKET